MLAWKECGGPRVRETLPVVCDDERYRGWAVLRVPFREFVIHVEAQAERLDAMNVIYREFVTHYSDLLNTLSDSPNRCDPVDLVRKVTDDAQHAKGNADKNE